MTFVAESDVSNPSLYQKMYFHDFAFLAAFLPFPETLYCSSLASSTWK